MANRDTDERIMDINPLKKRIGIGNRRSEKDGEKTGGSIMTAEEKPAILFDVDDTLYDQTVPFYEAYAEYFGAAPAVPADVIYPVTRKYSNAVYSRAMAGEILMEEMYIYRLQEAFKEFGIAITDAQALEFQKIYADRQRHIHMSPLMEEILEYCSGKIKLGIITNGPSEHQWNKVKSLRACGLCGDGGGAGAVCERNTGRRIR